MINCAIMDRRGTISLWYMYLSCIHRIDKNPNPVIKTNAMNRSISVILDTVIALVAGPLLILKESKGYRLE